MIELPEKRVYAICHHSFHLWNSILCVYHVWIQIRYQFILTKKFSLSGLNLFTISPLLLTQLHVWVCFGDQRMYSYAT